jgi:hypothetical protein
MKLSEATIEVLKNFSTINQSLLFNAGSVLTTVSPTMTILAKAKVTEKFPVDFAIYDLNIFLAKLSLYRDSCKLEFKDDRVFFKSEDGRRSDYMKFCSTKVIKVPPEKQLVLDDPLYEFVLSQEDLLWQRKSAGISGSQHLIFRGDGKKIYLQSTDMKNDAADLSSTEIGKTDGKFLCVVKVENWKMLDGSYRVKIKEGMTKFEHTEKHLEYFVAIESGLSKFN